MSPCHILMRRNTNRAVCKLCSKDKYIGSWSMSYKTGKWESSASKAASGTSGH